MSVIKSRMGKDMLAVDGYIYRKNNSNKSTQNWRCAAPKCNATAVSNLNYLETLDFKEAKPHNHPPNPTKKIRCDALRLFDEAARNSDASPRTIINKLCQSFDDKTVAVLPDIRALSKRIHRKRKEVQLKSRVGSMSPNEERKGETSGDIASLAKFNSNNVGLLTCSFCGERFTQRHSLLKHERVNHWGQGRRCRKCNREFRSGYILQHMKQCKGRPHRCRTCGENFHSARGLSRHKIVSHSQWRLPNVSQVGIGDSEQGCLSQQAGNEAQSDSLNPSWDESSKTITNCSEEINTPSGSASDSSASMPCLIPFTDVKPRLLNRSAADDDFEEVAESGDRVFQGLMTTPCKLIVEYTDEVQGFDQGTEIDEIPIGLKNQMAEEVFTVFRENWNSIRTQHAPDYQFVDRYNFMLTNFSLDEMKESIKSILSRKNLPFKVNLAFGYLVRDCESGNVSYVPASVNTKAVYDKPHMISDAEELDRFLGSIVLIMIAEKTGKQWQDPDTVVEAVTNLQMYVYRPGKAPDCQAAAIPGNNTGIPNSASGERPLFQDATSIFRCIAQKHGCPPASLNSRTGELYWKYASSIGEHLPNGVLLKDFNCLEELFGLQITVFRSDTNGRLKMLRHGKYDGDTLHLHLVGNCYHYIPDASDSFIM